MLMAGEPLRIVGRDDLVTATERLEYRIKTRTGKLWLPELCTVNCPGAIRLFKDIDPQVKRIEIYSGKVLDSVYEWDDGGGTWETRHR